MILIIKLTAFNSLNHKIKHNEMNTFAIKVTFKGLHKRKLWAHSPIELLKLIRQLLTKY